MDASKSKVETFGKGRDQRKRQQIGNVVLIRFRGKTEVYKVLRTGLEVFQGYADDRGL